MRRLGLAAALIIAPISAAHAGVEDWQVSELLTSSGGNAQIRYIEIFNPVGGCLFPTTRVEVLSAQGMIEDTVPLASTTECFEPGTYLFLATSQAEAAFARPADVTTIPPLPAAAGQVCIVSSATRYDCVRYGAISQPVTDLFGSTDTSAAIAPPDGLALARIATTHIVADDFAVQSPTPAAANTGVPWIPPDAGPPLPDAAPLVDAGPIPDAGPMADAGPSADAGLPMPPWDALPPTDSGPAPDAPNTRFLDLDATGGACGCVVGARPTGHSPVGMLALACALVAFLSTPSRRRREK